MLRKLPSRALLLLLKAYSMVLSPYMPGQCRYSPTCSQYARDAIAAHGALAGTWMTARRLARCTLWLGSGPDPAVAVAWEERQ